MTREELREKVAEAIGEAGADWLVSSEPNELISHKTADAAIRVVLEAALDVAKQHVGAAARDRRQRGQTFNTLPDHAVAEIQAEERGEDIAAEVIQRELKALLPQDKGTGS